MKRSWLIPLVVFVGIALLVAQLVLPGPRVVVSRQTTHLTTPLAADGLPDYAAYLLEQGREGVTPENNGAIPFLRAMWPAELQAEHRAPLCRHLGMEMPAAPGIADFGLEGEFGRLVLAWVEEQLAAGQEQGAELEEEAELGGGEEEWDEGPTAKDLAWMLPEHARSQPWRRSELPPLADWIDRHAAEYELLHAAAARPKFYCPSPSLLVTPNESLVSIMLSTVQAMRTAGNCLSLRGFLYLGEGDVAGAWRECEAIYRFSQHTSHEIMVSELVGIALGSVADRLALAILDSDRLTPELAREILAFQQSRSPRDTMVLAIDEGERLMFVTSVLQLAGEREAATIDEFVGSDMGPLKHVSVNWNVVLERGNAWYDRLVAATKLEDWSARRAAYREMESELDAWRDSMLTKLAAAVVSRSARSDAMAHLLMAIFTPALSAAMEAEDRANTHLLLHQVAAALAVHRLERGAYPEQLDELVPGLLKTVPIDPYGRPLVYRRTDQEGYLLYSLGVNGVDDRGSSDMMGCYEGYTISEEPEEVAVRQLLGMVPVGADIEIVDEVNGNYTDIEPSLNEKIPMGADDWSIRLPLPRVAAPGFPPPRE